MTMMFAADLSSSLMFKRMFSHLLVQEWESREAWIQHRGEAIGASEAAMALGVSPYGTPFSLWQRKRSKVTEIKKDVLQRGHRWEPSVLAEYEDESGYVVIDPRSVYGCKGPVTFARRDAPWLRVTPDGLVIPPRHDETGLVEAKTALRAHEWAPEAGIVIDKWDDAHADLVPAHYAVQGYTQLLVTGMPWVDLCALVPRSGWLGVRWVRLCRDDETQGQLFAALSEWYQRHIVSGEPPAIDGSEACNRYLAERFVSPSGKKKPQRPASREELDLMVRFHKIKQRMKKDEADADLIKNQLIELAKGERLVLADGPFGQPQNNAGKTLVDLDALRAEAPELVAKHSRKGTPFVTFNLYRFEKEET